MKIDANILKQCWFLAGPTAVGKSALSLELATTIDAEILSLDSMAIYREMDIGTAKPSLTEQKSIPHHLIDMIDPSEEFSTADYLQAADSTSREILNRSRIPLYVGGTGLYLRSILRGVFEGPAADWDYRRELENLEKNSPGQLHRQLHEIDPESANRLHSNDQRRIIRALEVYHLTGIPLSVQQLEFECSADERSDHVFWLHPPRDWLYERINRRVDQMMNEGLIDEVQALLARNPPIGRSARQGLGYKEVIDHLENGIELDECIEQIKTRTRQFAKRQHTWFRNLPECQEIAITGEESPDEIIQLIISQEKDIS